MSTLLHQLRQLSSLVLDGIFKRHSQTIHKMYAIWSEANALKYIF